MAARGFHPLTVAAVDRLCADAVAVTFAVPAELREIFAFRPGQSLDLAELVAFLEPSLARFKLPKDLVVVDALPRNAGGKVVKPELRERVTKR